MTAAAKQNSRWRFTHSAAAGCQNAQQIASLQGQIDCGRRQFSFLVGVRVEKKRPAKSFSATCESLDLLTIETNPESSAALPSRVTIHEVVKKRNKAAAASF